jgi:hypothetical protein
LYATLSGPATTVLRHDVHEVAAQSLGIIATAARHEEAPAITSCWRSQSSSVVSTSGFETERPALFTTRSTPPNASNGIDGRADLRISYVDTDADRGVGAAELRRDGVRGSTSIGDDDTGSFVGKAGRDRV